MFGDELVAVPVVDGSNFRCQLGCSLERHMTLLFAPFRPRDRTGEPKRIAYESR
jgi:hypothetical protein